MNNSCSELDFFSFIRGFVYAIYLRFSIQHCSHNNIIHRKGII